MKRERKILLFFGSLIIAALIAAGSFSLGVVVGKDLEPSSLPERTRQLEPTPSNRQTRGIDNQPDFIGIITRLTRNDLDIRTENGIRTVLLAAETKFLLHKDGETSPTAVDTLGIGNRVAIYGISIEQVHTVYAAAIVILQPSSTR